LPEELERRVDRLARRVASVEEDHDDLRRDVRNDIRELRAEMRERFDTVDADHERVPAVTRKAVADGLGRVNWKSLGATVLAVATGVGGPIAAAWLLAGGA
jgi:hypothetical protein